MSKISILMEFWEFLRVRKKYWLMPIVTMLILMGRPDYSYPRLGRGRLLSTPCFEIDTQRASCNL